MMGNSCCGETDSARPMTPATIIARLRRSTRLRPGSWRFSAVVVSGPVYGLGVERTGRTMTDGGSITGNCTIVASRESLALYCRLQLTLPLCYNLLYWNAAPIWLHRFRLLLLITAFPA